MINLISDTVTKPTKGMLEFMTQTQVGDDVFGTDPSVNKLEQTMATNLGMEAGLFCPSGTMTNQIAIKVLTQPLDEMICEATSHVYRYETGGYAFNSGIAVTPIQGINGKITIDDIDANIKGDYDWLPSTKLVCLENSCNAAGGTFYNYHEMKKISDWCRQNHLSVHLDGARLYNVLVKTKDDSQAIGGLFDTISICFSKGLGAPVGSILLGSKENIKKARRFRKVMGGGMRQAGYLAASCIYALEHNIQRLVQDNQRASTLGTIVKQLSYVINVKPVQTNIVIFDLAANILADEFITYLNQNNITASAFGKNQVRFVTHLDISDNHINQVAKILKNYKKK